ncbi:MAG: hypothetical protein JST48_12035 [Bacteroidetes bacterium]|nr:hypothetical protein [Bacteroidota bacterium]
MKKDYILELAADNNFSVLNRIINILNRRRVRIKKLTCFEDATDFRTGRVIMRVYTTIDLVERVKHQLEKLIEVEEVKVLEETLHFQSVQEQKELNQLVTY